MYLNFFGKKCVLSSLLWMHFCAVSYGGVSILESAGWHESAYVEWNEDPQYQSYNVYCKASGGEYLLLDAALVRDYGSYGRADVLGLPSGTCQLKVVPVKESVEVVADAVESDVLDVLPHDRSGYAFTGDFTPGAYKADGTLKENALVFYVTEENKDKISAEIQTSSNGTKTSCTGIVAILTALKKGYDARPVTFRFIGKVTNSGAIGSDSNFKGDIMVDLGGSNAQMTLEGVGEDATAYGWGVRVKNTNYLEVRNLGFMYCNSAEGDNVGLQQGNKYVWVHHNDMFYGQPGSDKDQVKGDGALDCKKSNFITFSYNHFWDSGKCNLLGLSEGVKSTADNAYYITYHHNWYDHSDSRHPRCRYYNAHVYNNYYDGNAKYGAGSTLGSSVFMQNNFFRSCKYPMLTSMQGSDVYATGDVRDNSENPTFSKEDGGVIKASGNIMTGIYTFVPYASTQIVTAGVVGDASGRGIDTKVDFDAVVVEDPSETIPSSIVSYEGANVYSNFDTKDKVVLQANVDAAEDVVDVVTGSQGAGRMNHGDVDWTFSESDDTDYGVIQGLLEKIANYRSSFVGFYGEVDDSTTGGGSGTDQPNPDPEPNPTPDPTPIVGEGMELHFSGMTPSNTAFYTLTNASYSNSKGSAVVDGQQYSDCLKMESTTSVSFTTTEQSTLVLVFGASETPLVKLNGEKTSAIPNAEINGNVLVVRNLPVGNYELTKENSVNLFYVSVVYPDEETGLSLIQERSEIVGEVYDIYGRRVDVIDLKENTLYYNNGRLLLFRK
jgi:pectate lyase